MNWRNRKMRIGIVVAIAVFVAFYAWRTNQPATRDCTPGREEVKDASGKVIEIKRMACG